MPDAYGPTVDFGPSPQLDQAAADHVFVRAGVQKHVSKAGPRTMGKTNGW